MKLKKRIQITKRGYALLNQYCPGLMRAKVAAAIAEALSPFVTIWFSAQIINEIAGERNKTRIMVYVLCIILLRLILSVIGNTFNKVIEEKQFGMWGYFRKIFSDKQMSMDFADLEDQEIQKMRQKADDNLFMFGNGLGQLVWDTTTTVTVIVDLIASISLTASLFLAKSGNAWMDSWVWMPVGLGIMICAGVCNASLKKKEESIFEKWMDGTVWYNRTFMFYGHEMYANSERAKDARIYRQDRIADRELVRLQEHKKTDQKHYRRMSGCQGYQALLQGICNGLCYLFVVAKASTGAFAVGYIVQYVGALMKLVHSCGDLIFTNSENKVYTAHLDRLFEYLDLPNKKYQGKIPVEKGFYCADGENDYEIEFRNVSFCYPGTQTYVLKNINTKLNIGKKQALVGANGAGKTTFVKLLCRLYDPTEGEILLNGIDIRKYDYEEYMRLFAFVFQDFKLFSFPLGQNVAADLSYDEERAKKCLRKVSFEERLETMPEGLETYLYKEISENGVDISGGEAQKIALARALYKETPLIVLDEPTAALDPIAEATVYADFDQMVDHKTAIYVSHRLSSCRFCDEIMVFDNGQIVQKGTHEELVKENTGKYYALWSAQAQYYQEGAQ